VANRSVSAISLLAQFRC